MLYRFISFIIMRHSLKSFYSDKFYNQIYYGRRIKIKRLICICLNALECFGARFLRPGRSSKWAECHIPRLPPAGRVATGRISPDQWDDWQRPLTWTYNSWAYQWNRRRVRVKRRNPERPSEVHSCISVVFCRQNIWSSEERWPLSTHRWLSLGKTTSATQRSKKLKNCSEHHLYFCFT